MRHTAPLVARAAADTAALPNAHPSERALPAVLSAPPYTVTASPPLASAARALVPIIESSLLDCARPAAVCGGSYANVPSGVDASAEADAPTVTGTRDPAAPDGDTHWTCCQAPPSPYMPFAPCGIDGSAPTDTVPKVQRHDADMGEHVLSPDTSTLEPPPTDPADASFAAKPPMPANQ